MTVNATLFITNDTQTQVYCMQQQKLGKRERERGPVNGVRSVTGMCKHHVSKILHPKGKKLIN